MENKILLLNSPLREQIWGGYYFRDILKLTNDDKKYGEYWTLSGYKDYPSIIKNSKLQGKTLDEIYKEHHELFESSTSLDFPILIKIIATSDDLSVQVHPNDEYAKKDNEYGKTESWLILDNEPSSKIVYGHNLKTREELIDCINKDNYDFLTYHDVKKGMFVPVEAGTIHSLGKGLVLIEVQQSSNLTYRIYDYKRKDKNGMYRRLDKEKAIDVITIPDIKHISDKNYLDESKDTIICDNDLFKIEIINVKGKLVINKENNKYYLCCVVEGSFEYDGYKINYGDSFIITSICHHDTVNGTGKIVVVESYR